MDQKKPTEHRRWTRRVPRPPRGWRARPTPWVRPLPCGCHMDPLTCPRCQHLLYIPKLPEQNLDQEFCRRKPLWPPKTNRDPVPAPYRRGGGSITGGHFHPPGALHDEERVVLPRGYGYVPVAMCLISLYLSRVPCTARS